jgi:multidrug efflux pump subunit AcrB
VNLVEFGVKKPVAANLIMLAIIGAGLVLGLNLRREFFPETRPNEVLVVAPYPGAAPEEVERSLAIKIEDRVADIEDVKEVNTSIVEGAATIRVEFESGVEIADATARVKREVDALQDLPPLSERITVEDFEPQIPVIDLTLFGDADERTMKESVKQMRDDLRTLPGMGDVLIGGTRVDEISVEVDPTKLLAHGIGLIEVTERIRAAMGESPGGTVRSASANIAVRTRGADDLARDVRDIIVKTTPDGGIVRVSDIARITDGFADVDVRLRYNGKPAASLTVYAQKKQDIVEMAQVVKAYAAGRTGDEIHLSGAERSAIARAEKGQGLMPPRWQAYMLGQSHDDPPPGQLESGQDLSRFVTQRLELLSRNALTGAAIVLIALVIFLPPTVAFWVTAGLVISVLGTLAAMSMFDITLNLLTMFGLIIVLGLLVDDAIVVAENIVARHETGESALDAAMRGGQQVFWPVVVTVTTTVCAFLPLRLIEGRVGDLMGALPLVVAIALFVSLIEALIILPSHMAHTLRRMDKRGPGGGPIKRFGDWAERKRDWFFHGWLARPYARLLQAALKARYLTFAIFAGVLISCVGLVAGGRVPFDFLASADSETILVNLKMPVGTPAHQTNDVVERIERVALALPEVKAVQAFVGASNDVNDGTSTNQSNRGQLFIQLLPVEERDRSSQELRVAMQRDIGEIPGVKSLRFEEIQGGPGGPPLSYTILGSDIEQMQGAVTTLRRALEEFEGVFGVADDADVGQRELRIELLPGARELGFTTDLVARQVRGAVFGLEARTFAGDREDIDVRVKFDEENRRSLAAIEQMYVFTPNGRSAPLREVASVTESRGYASINRLNRQRAINVSADVDRALVTPEQVSAELGPLFREIQAEFPGVTIVPRGRQEDLGDSFRSLPLGFAAAMVMIYVLLAWLFGSYTQPFAILTAVPFAAVGAILGHLLLGFEMTILSLIGFVALTGIVVNDGIVLVEFYNEKRREGMDIMPALTDAGRARLRAIILTTVTTVGGLAPLMLEQSFQARFLIPMAITISFGLMAATVVTLVLLPCLIAIVADIRRAIRWGWSGGAAKWNDPLTPAGTLD